MDSPEALLAKPEGLGLFRGLWERHQRSHGGGTGTPGHGPSRSSSKGDLAALADASAALGEGSVALEEGADTDAADKGNKGDKGDKGDREETEGKGTRGPTSV